MPSTVLDYITHSEQQVDRLMALRDVDSAISSSFDLRTTLDVIIDHVVNQLKVDAARILLYNPYTQTLDLSVARGFRSISKQDLHQRIIPVAGRKFCPREPDDRITGYPRIRNQCLKVFARKNS